MTTPQVSTSSPRYQPYKSQTYKVSDHGTLQISTFYSQGKGSKAPKQCANCGTQETTLWATGSSPLFSLSLSLPYQFCETDVFCTLTQCVSDPTKQRKFKSAEDVKSKRPERDIDTSRADLKGETGCNACCLYWALHGKHRPLGMKNGQAPTRRKRKQKKERQHARVGE